MGVELVRWAGAVALVAIVAAGATACGDDDSADDGSPGAAGATSTPTDEPSEEATEPGAAPGAPVVDQADLEREISTRLTELAGQAPDDVTCPADGLTGEVGGSVRCVLTAGTDRLGVTVTVTGVQGARVDFDIEVDDEVMTEPPAPSEKSTDQPTEGAT